jgi:hypothetical protein
MTTFDDHGGGAELADWLIDKVAHQALATILEENRKVHILEDRIDRLERRLQQLGIDPLAFD